MFRLHFRNFRETQASGNIGELLVAMRNAKFAEDLVQAAEEWCQEQGAELLEEVAQRFPGFFGGGVAGVLGMEKNICAIWGNNTKGLLVEKMWLVSEYDECSIDCSVF